ncbi:hypothetical protein ACLOJK_037436 [Asimina triloba]
MAKAVNYYANNHIKTDFIQMRNCAFVDFMDETMASQAQSQLRFLGKMLSVERAGKLSDGKNQQNDMQPGKDPSLPSASLLKDAQVPGDLSKGSIAGSVLAAEPIAPKLGVDYPFPRHLEYAYPPPDGNILTNIVNALIAVPRFYTQVLHLMNKMNIPAPFRMALPTPPLPPSVPHPPPPPPPPPLPPQTTAVKPNVTDLSSDESEMESSNEGDTDEKNKSGRKRTRREAIVGPAVDKTVAHEAVGVKPATLVPKELRVIKKKHPVLQIKIIPKSVQNEEMDDGCSVKEPSNLTNEGLEPKPFVTPEEIERGKLPPEEILSLPMFKNYTAGNPTTVLYIKNLAKDVVLDDFYYIFGNLSLKQP